MRFKYFIGENKVQIFPSSETREALPYYVWCLQNVFVGLRDAQSDEERKGVFKAFIDNMNKLPEAQKMFGASECSLHDILGMQPLPSNEYILSLIRGIPLGDAEEYVTVRQRLLVE